MNLKDIRLIKSINESITWKLFVVTVIVFIIFISSTLVIQSVFFSQFYISKKEDNLQKGIEKFKVAYDKSEDGKKITDLIRDFEESHNAKIVILDNKGRIKFITKSNSERSDAARIRIINETIKNWTLRSDILSEMRENNKSITILTEKNNNEIRSIISAIPSNNKDEIIFAITSLQPVNEATYVIKEFYFYFYFGAIFLIIILSLLYSNMISKPLLQLNKAASKMAELDFSDKLVIQREDEIGSLATTLSFLSDNLDKALTSLKEANAKLEEDIEKERRIERMRKEFVAAVSHELKTPISLIGGYAEGLKDGVFEAEEKEYYIDVIMDESKKMSNLVSDLLDLSQLESGNFRLVKERFYINELLKYTIKKFGSLIDEKNIKLKVVLLDEICIYADWARMEQVVTNFITNAIRHTEENGQINIGIEEIGNDNYQVYIENSGSLIPEEEKNKIWDNFYKIDKSRNRKLGGTGIGLAIVKNILMLHGYEYGVENTEYGVKFYFIVNKSMQ